MSGTSYCLLPNGERAVIDDKKITEYCLNFDHDDGRHKAHLFQVRVGLNLGNWTLLRDALKRAAKTGDAVEGKTDKYGVRYQIDFDFAGPSGTDTIRSAWIVKADEELPSLVSCYIRKPVRADVDRQHAQDSTTETVGHSGRAPQSE